MGYDIEFDINNNLQVKERNNSYQIDLSTRLMDFSVDIIKFLGLIPLNKEYDVIKYQLSKAATSVGANYEESQAGSYSEFTHRIQISLREIRESHYWLKLIQKLKISQKQEYCEKLIALLKESEELKRIFGSISAKTKNKSLSHK
jgi:four helix bundle protein